MKTVFAHMADRRGSVQLLCQNTLQFCWGKVGLLGASVAAFALLAATPVVGAESDPFGPRLPVFQPFSVDVVKVDDPSGKTKAWKATVVLTGVWDSTLLIGLPHVVESATASRPCDAVDKAMQRAHAAWERKIDDDLQQAVKDGNLAGEIARSIKKEVANLCAAGKPDPNAVQTELSQYKSVLNRVCTNDLICKIDVAKAAPITRQPESTDPWKVTVRVKPERIRGALPPKQSDATSPNFHQALAKAIHDASM